MIYLHPHVHTGLQDSPSTDPSLKGQLARYDPPTDGILLFAEAGWKYCCNTEGNTHVEAAFSAANPHLYLNVNEFQILLERRFWLGNSGHSGLSVWGKGPEGVEWGRRKGKEAA